MKLDTALTSVCSQPNQCFMNVARLVKANGGRIVFGWLRCDYSGEVEAWVHHAVWESPEGKMIDVTPQWEAEGGLRITKEVEFEPDEEATLLNGFQRPPRIIPTEPRFAKAAEYSYRSYCRSMANDVQGANYWTDRANAELAKATHGNPKMKWVHLNELFQNTTVPLDLENPGEGDPIDWRSLLSA